MWAPLLFRWEYSSVIPTAIASVNSGDSVQTRSRAGQLTDATNFRSDVNEDAVINSGDSNIVKASAGTALPP